MLERHILTCAEHILGQMRQAQVFYKLDATASFHQVKLAEQCQELTIFITPLGRFCFQRQLFSICSVPEYFQHQMSSILEDLEGLVNMIDDILVFGSMEGEYDSRLHEVMQRLRDAGVKLSRAKCAFSARVARLLGVVVGTESVRLDPEKIRALMDLISGVHRLLGMTNHLGHFLPHLSDVTALIRALIQKSSAWVWGPAQ